MTGDAIAATVRHAGQADLAGMVAIAAACDLDWTITSLQVIKAPPGTNMRALTAWAMHAPDGMHCSCVQGSEPLCLQKEIERHCAEVLVVDDDEAIAAMLVAWLIADEVCPMAVVDISLKVQQSNS
jgi:hypothetical protein